MQKRFDATEIRQALSRGIVEAGWEISEKAQAQLVHYVALLYQWNQTHNLTAVRDPLEMVERHVLDSLTLLPYVMGAHRMLDVGTGAGLPGLPLAVCNPAASVFLLDSRQKKTMFLKQVVRTLALPNVTVLDARVESYSAATQFDIVVSRAFASLADFVLTSDHLCGAEGVWIAMKGEVSREEEVALPSQYYIKRKQAVSETKRQLVFIKRGQQRGQHGVS